MNIIYVVEYKLNESTSKVIEKILSFEIRTSLYNDPFSYTLKIGAKYEDTASDKLVSELNKKYTQNALSNKEYNPIVR